MTTPQSSIWIGSVMIVTVNASPLRHRSVSLETELLSRGQDNGLSNRSNDPSYRVLFILLGDRDLHHLVQIEDLELSFSKVMSATDKSTRPRALSVRESENEKTAFLRKRRSLRSPIGIQMTIRLQSKLGLSVVLSSWADIHRDLTAESSAVINSLCQGCAGTLQSEQWKSLPPVSAIISKP